MNEMASHNLKMDFTILDLDREIATIQSFSPQPTEGQRNVCQLSLPHVDHTMFIYL